MSSTEDNVISSLTSNLQPVITISNEDQKIVIENIVMTSQNDKDAPPLIEVRLKYDTGFDDLKESVPDSVVVSESVDVQCRTCLATCARAESISVSLLDSNTTQTYSVMLQAVTGVQTQQSDMLCDICRSRTLDAYQFRLQARQSDTQLTGNTHTEEIQNTKKVEVLSDDDVQIHSFEPEISDNEDKPLSLLTERKGGSRPKPMVQFAKNECINCKESFKTFDKLRKHKLRCRRPVTRGKLIVNSEIKSDTNIENDADGKQLKSNQCGICFTSFDDVVSLVHHVRTSHKKVIGIKQEPMRKITPKRLLNQVLMKSPVKLQTKRYLNAKKKLETAKEMLNIRRRRISSQNYKACNIPVKGLLKEPVAVEGLKTVRTEPKKKLKDLYRCGVCIALFDNEVDLDTHCREHGGSEVIMCALCERVYLKYSQFKRHFNDHHPELTDIINAETTETILEMNDTDVLQQLLEHVRMTSIGDLVSANIVPQEQPMEIEAYVQVCGLCGAVILSPEQLKLHNAAEHPDFQYQCYLCAKRYPDPHLRRMHIVHCRRSDLRYECVYCGERTITHGKLESHVKRAHPDKKDAWAVKYCTVLCDLCGAAFHSKTQLKTHVIHCGPDGEFPCPECSKVFPREMVLHRHMYNVHNKTKTASRTGVKYAGEHEYLCAECGKCSKTKAAFERHNRTHTGERPFKCDMCEKAYATSHQLKYHKWNHTGNTPFHCIQCDRKFGRPASYRRHMMIHSGERPHHCDVCGLGFIQKGCLKAHMKKHGNYEQSIPLDPHPFKQEAKWKSEKDEDIEEKFEEVFDDEMVVDDTFSQRRDSDADSDSDHSDCEYKYSPKSQARKPKVPSWKEKALVKKAYKRETNRYDDDYTPKKKIHKRSPGKSLPSLDF